MAGMADLQGLWYGSLLVYLRVDLLMVPGSVLLDESSLGSFFCQVKCLELKIQEGGK